MTEDQSRAVKFGLPFALAGMALILFTSLKFGQRVFWIGLYSYLLGLVGFVYSLHTFNITPLGEPVSSGLYKFSRNPQWVAFALALLGCGVVVGSWTILLLLMDRVFMNHIRILGEVQGLETQYGKSYLVYKKSVPR